MNIPIMQLAAKALQNKHTTGAAVVYAAAKWGCPLLATWWPSHKAQLETTAGILEGAAVFYGFAAAGDASKSVQAHEETLAQLDTIKSAVRNGDTSILDKPVANPPAKP